MEPIPARHWSPTQPHWLHSPKGDERIDMLNFTKGKIKCTNKRKCVKIRAIPSRICLRVNMKECYVSHQSFLLMIYDYLIIITFCLSPCVFSSWRPGRYVSRAADLLKETSFARILLIKAQKPCQKNTCPLISNLSLRNRHIFHNDMTSPPPVHTHLPTDDWKPLEIKAHVLSLSFLFFHIR